MLVVYEGTATVTSILAEHLVIAPPFTTAKVGDEFRFRAIIDTSIPGILLGGDVPFANYVNAVRDIDLWLAGQTRWPPPPRNADEMNRRVQVANDYDLSSVLDSVQKPYDWWLFYWIYEATDNNRYVFSFQQQDNDAAMLSSDAIPVAIDDRLSGYPARGFERRRRASWLLLFAGHGHEQFHDYFGFRVCSNSCTLIPSASAPARTLANKVILAQTYYAVPDITSTCAVLQSYLDQVTAWKGKKVSPCPSRGTVRGCRSDHERSRLPVSEIRSRLSGNHIVVLMIGFLVVFSALLERGRLGGASSPQSSQACGASSIQ